MLRDIFKLSALALVVLFFAYTIFEPTVGSAATATDTLTVTQVVTSGISISAPADITMTPLSTSQNSAVGSAAWTVTTNNYAGYTLGVKASTAPALSRSGGGGNIADYTPAVAGTPDTWSVTSAAEFGMSARGTDVVTGTWGTDSDCINTADVPSATLKWRDFDITDVQIAVKGTQTTTSGIATTMCVATQQVGVFADSGTYTASVTATATTQ